MAHTTRIGFIGLGSMGSGMASRVLHAGFPLTVYNRTAGRTDLLAKHGATVAISPREVARSSDVIILMLADPNAVAAVLHGPDGILMSTSSDHVLIDMSTVGPNDVVETLTASAISGMRVLHAPVLGPPSAAAAGTLTILVGGDADLIDAHRLLLSALGDPIIELATNQQASALKLACNSLLLSSLQLFGEIMALAEGWGVDREQLWTLFDGSPLMAPALRGRMRSMFEEDASTQFSLRLGRKDLMLANNAAYEKGVGVPLIATALQTYSLAMKEFAGEDIARIGAFIAEQVDRQ